MSDKKTPNAPGQMNIELPEEIADGIYSNLALIAHSPTEFVVDFIRMVPNVNKAKVKARIILTPQHAKRFLQALEENIERYENQFGPIDGGHTPPMDFTPPKAQA